MSSTAVALVAAAATLGAADGTQCLQGPCRPGNEQCGAPFSGGPRFHLQDQRGCGENDPNGPVFDPVHGVIHHFYQDHLAAGNGSGPIYGHFVSKDFLHWAQLPVAIWNGLDTSSDPPRATPYDTVAIFTGSATVVDGAAPDGKGPGIVSLYPALCDKDVWPQCNTGTLLGQAVPADYAGDALLTNWTKPSYNPILNDTQRDPSTPWRTPSGEWRFKTYDLMYGAASDADVIAGKWYSIGPAAGFETNECPSIYPLPGPTAGFEAEYDAARRAGELPTHVHKLSYDHVFTDHWQVGTYESGAPKSAGHFHATPGWEDLFKWRLMDAGAFYASKDNVYPDKEGRPRRINWGWAKIPNGAQTLPRLVTFNAAARVLEQAPLEELSGLRGPAALEARGLALPAGSLPLDVPGSVAAQGEVLVSVELPDAAARFGLELQSAAGSVSCEIEYRPPAADLVVGFYEVPVRCGEAQDVLRLLPRERALQLRLFADHTLFEAFFQNGRVAMTIPASLDGTTKVALTASQRLTVRTLQVFPLQDIWVSEDDVRASPRVYPAIRQEGTTSLAQAFV